MLLGPNSGSVTLNCVDPDAVVYWQRADTPCGSRGDFFNYFAQPGHLSLVFGMLTRSFAIDASPFSYIGWCDVIIDLHGRQQATLYGLGLNPSSILTSLLTRAWDLITTLGIYEPWHNVVIGSLVVSVTGLLLGCLHLSFSLTSGVGGQSSFLAWPF